MKGLVGENLSHQRFDRRDHARRPGIRHGGVGQGAQCLDLLGGDFQNRLLVLVGQSLPARIIQGDVFQAVEGEIVHQGAGLVVAGNDVENRSIGQIECQAGIDQRGRAGAQPLGYNQGIIDVPG
ncbi:MAG: hypothetical protein BWZ10_02088 [candidate division BRC1 bacterium ADurb.BinA364]|nr:MAG: hypothetical protein BWZ10_02088 [candidate division BRC1 bacterium ADurb.BinA364]